MDEFEIEVTDLRKKLTDAPPETAITERGDNSSPASARAPVDPPSQSLQRGASGPTPPQRMPRSRRHRQLQSGLVAAMLLLAVASILGSVPGSTATLASLLHIATPVPTAPLAPGADNIIAAHGVPWGTLLVDGHALPDANLHIAYQGVFRLARGQHTLIYHASPFPTVRCTVSVPLSPRDTCPLLDTSRLGGQPNGIPGDTRIVDLRATPDRLPRDQLAALTDGVVEALAAWLPPASASATVAPGERYVAADGSIATADQPLRATFLYTLNLDQPHSIGGDSCVTFCAPPAIEAPLSEVWVVYILVHHGWRYADASSAGRVRIPYAPAIPATLVSRTQPFDTFDFIVKQFSVRWNGAWRVTPSAFDASSADPSSDPTCTIGMDLLSTLYNDITAPFEFSPSPLLPHVADGCLLRALPVNDPNHPAYFLYRFGVLLAVGSVAHTARPTLPVATPGEYALAQQAATRSGMWIAP